MKILNLLWKNWHYLLGILVFALILYRIDLIETITIILELKIFYFIISTLLSIPVFFLRSLRWRYILLKLKIIYNFKPVMSIYFASLYLGLVTPGRLGEFTKLIYLNHDGYPFGKSLFSVIIDRLFDFILLLIIATIGILIFSNLFYFPNLVFYGFFTLFVIIVLIILIKIRKDSLQKNIIKILNFVIPRKFRKILITESDDFFKNINIFSLISLLNITGITIASSLLYFLQAYFLILSLGISINFFYLVFTVSLAAIAAIVPISILGIGTRDAALIFLLSHAGIRSELAIAFSVLILLNILILAFFCLPFWLANAPPINYKKEIKNNY